MITCGLFFFQRGDTGIIAEVCFQQGKVVLVLIRKLAGIFFGRNRLCGLIRKNFLTNNRVDFVRDFGMVAQVQARVLAPLTNALVLVAEPRAALVDVCDADFLSGYNLAGGASGDFPFEPDVSAD